ncbi:MAG: hypothetical protein ACI9YH_002159 [Colwellia sp.]|jgi:hypothetical protein
MRTLIILLSSVLLNPIQAFSTEHTVASQINFNSEQDANVGYGILYQYTFSENIEFEAKYNQSGDLKVISDEKIILGEYSSFSSGINFIKQRSPKLSLKVGLGLNTVTSSSNNYLIEQNSIAPYFQISANYKVTERLSLTLGQTTLFHNDVIGTNHSLFISVNWVFGTKTTSSLIKTVDVIPLPLEVIPQSVPVKTPSSSIVIEKQPQYVPQWYVQIGAYQKHINAQHMNSILLEKHSLVLSIQLHNELYRLLSHSFSDNKSAEEYLNTLQTRFQISGFINKF